MTKELTDDQIDNVLPLGMAPYLTLCGPTEIRRFARAVIAADRAARISEYPALPPAGRRGPDGTGSYFDAYTADQMRTYAAQAVEVDRAARGVPDEETRQAVQDAVADALGDAYDCMRVWSAWGVGTMGPDDFCLVSEDDDRVAEIADAAINAMLAAAPQPAEQPEPERLRHVGDSTFESWYAGHPKAIGGDKQLARDAYAAGMSDPAAQPERKPMTREHRKALIESAINARDDDGLITDMEREAHSETNRMMTEALTQAEAARGVPDGQVLAPKEPTTEMILALIGTGLRHAEYRNKAASPSIEEMKQGYRAMLAAAPQPAAQPDHIPDAGKMVAQPELTDDELRPLIPQDMNWKYVVGEAGAIEFARAVIAAHEAKKGGAA